MSPDDLRYPIGRFEAPGTIAPAQVVHHLAHITHLAGREGWSHGTESA